MIRAGWPGKLVTESEEVDAAPKDFVVMDPEAVPWFGCLVEYIAGWNITIFNRNYHVYTFNSYCLDGDFFFNGFYLGFMGILAGPPKATGTPQK